MKQEKVKFGQLKMGAVFYWSDPEANRFDVLPDYKTDDLEADPNVEVWVVFQEEKNPYLKKPAKSYWIKERNNPQFDKPYYVAEGQLSKAAAKRKEGGGGYGFNVMLEFKTEEEYLAKIESLKTEGLSVHNG